MALWKKVLISAVVLVVLLAGAFVIFVGPWPTYAASFEGTRYFANDLARIDKAAQQCKITDHPGPLKAGWGTAKITPPVGTPLAGYSARNGKPSTGVHDELYVKAVAFSDGEDTAVVVGADMLLVPPNVANAVREAVAKETPLTANNIFFTASHTHDSVGAFMPGPIAAMSFGKYDPKIPPMLTKAFTSAVLDAYKSMEPAKLAHGDIDAHQYIHNRTRNAGVDPVMNWMLIENARGKRCFMVRFSGHGTILDDDNMEISAEFPGYLQRAVEKETGATAVYLGGAVCSMSPSAPDAPTAFQKCEALGNALAQLVLQAAQNPTFTNSADVASVSVPLDLPPFQMRLWSTKWRLSPFARFLVGIPATGWMATVRVGDVVFVNGPGELSGEIASTWREWTTPKGLDLWASGFSGDYSGYISPDRYYGEVLDKKGNMAYETGQLSWLGPHMEGFFTALMQHMVEAVDKPAPAPAGPAR
jgi:hypothetical protein